MISKSLMTAAITASIFSTFTGTPRKRVMKLPQPEQTEDDKQKLLDLAMIKRIHKALKKNLPFHTTVGAKTVVDGDEWCCYRGKNLQEAVVVGWGDTKETAQKNFKTLLLQHYQI